MRYAVVIEPAGNGFSGYAPDLPGCIAAGQSVDEVESLMHEAIALHLQGMRQDGARIPPANSVVEYMEVAV